jgi:hypothetical protein
MTESEIIQWLLQGDVAIQYQTYRDLLGVERNDIQQRIVNQGWGRQFLSSQNTSGHWGLGFYQPKWTSTHYTLLDLKNLGISQDCKAIRHAIDLILKNQKGRDGGINPSGTIENSDVCINGMALNYFSYFRTAEADLRSIVDFILSEHMEDGGFNCRSNRSGARHSSLHTTLSILEGILEYKNNNYGYRLKELLNAASESIEFMLQHRLFKSDKTGKIIRKQFLKLSWPSRWYFDILRALDYLQHAGVEYDQRMQDAIDEIQKKKTKAGLWKLQANHPGKFHFYMEEVGKPSRWNTLRALRVTKYFINKNR